MEQAISATLNKPQAAATPPVEWNLMSRIIFRFVCVYWVLYILPSPGRGSFLGVIPGAWLYVNASRAIVSWAATRVFHLSVSVVQYRPTGSGDTTLDYIQTFCFFVIAAAGTILWSVLDRKRKEYRTLHQWLRLLVRYTLAITLFSYGFSKVFPLQFPYPPLTRLIEPLGDFSPMGILWNFMGSSPAYTMFAGAAEVTGGILLVFARTATLGAMVSAAVMLNVVVLNFCYDVPVKLYSSHLLLMAVFLLAPDLGRLFNFFVRNRPAQAVSPAGPIFERRWMRISALALKIVVVGFFLGQDVIQSYFAYRAAVVRPTRPVLYGIYSVETFTRNGQEVPPLATDTERWKTMIAAFPTFIQVETMDGIRRGFQTKYDSSLETVTLGTGINATFAYSRPDASHVVLKGNLAGHAVTIVMRRKDSQEFLLVNRGFHWINEVPFNR